MKAKVKKAKVSLELKKLDYNGLITVVHGVILALTGHAVFVNPTTDLGTLGAQLTELETNTNLRASGHNDSIIRDKQVLAANNIDCSPGVDCQLRGRPCQRDG